MPAFKNHKIIILSSFILYLAVAIYPMFADVSISVKDTAIERGVISTLNIFGTVDESALNSISLYFTFDSRIIDIKAVTGNDQFCMKANSTVYKMNFQRIDKALLEIHSSNAQNINQGIICQLQLEGLVFSDSLVTPVLDSVFVNGMKIDNFNFTKGTIKVNGLPFLSHLPDALGNLIPNPFILQSKADFSIENKTQVKFSIYNTLGAVVATSDDNAEEIFVVHNLDKTEIIKDFGNPFEPGNYRLYLTPPVWTMSQGLYFLILETQKGKYKNSFIYFKK